MIMWIAEVAPATFPADRPGRTILRHRSRKSACKALGNHISQLPRLDPALVPATAMCQAAGDMFAAAPADFHPQLRIGNLVYRIRQETTA
jgi:hypothetical protein